MDLVFYHLSLTNTISSICWVVLQDASMLAFVLSLLNIWQIEYL